MESYAGKVPRMDLSTQSWVELQDGLWIGWEKEEKPTPEHLARESHLPGKSITMADGTTWQVPMLREWRLNDTDVPPIVFQIKVPRVLKRNDAGKWVEGDVLEGYREIWDRSAPVFELMALGSNTIELDDSDVIDFAVDLLSVNYRIGYQEASALGLFTLPIAAEVVRIGVDAQGFADAWESYQKKELSRSGLIESNSGYGAERPTTGEATSTPTAQPVAN